ncbi:MAG TPA: hypothetical protein VIF62_32115, partial [Labilithrix sp.]
MSRRRRFYGVSCPQVILQAFEAQVVTAWNELRPEHWLTHCCRSWVLPRLWQLKTQSIVER